MIRRIKNSLEDLTLTQQLLAVIAASVGIFLLFIIFYLNYNLDGFVRDRVFDMIDSNQSLIVSQYQLDHTQGLLEGEENSFIVHAIYDAEKDCFEKSSLFPEDEQFFEEVRAEILSQQEDSGHYSRQYQDQEQLYAIRRINSEKYLISMISELYHTTFKSALIERVIQLALIVVLSIVILLLLWVTTLIRALGQLTSYTEKVKKGEEASLNISRKDEIGDLAVSLVEMNEELQKQQRIKEELIQNISHDLKTPIATIKSYAESIKDGVYPYDSLEKSVDVIIEHSERLEKKVQNLLLLNRVGYLVANEETGSVDLKDVIDKTLLSIKVIRPDIEIETDTVSSVFYGDEEPWRVVLENLLDNAMRYAKSRIKIRLKENEFSIENDGPFMSEERIDKLFKPYEKGTDGKFGLGLSIVYKIVTVYNCEVYAFNAHNGVVFKITKKYGDASKVSRKKKSKRTRRK